VLETPEAVDVDPQPLLEATRDYLSDADRAMITRAFEFASFAHGDQKREDGTPYITHPLAVAQKMAEMHLDAPALAASLLHDVLEDCPVLPSDLEQEFGPEVTKLVDGVTKLTRAPWFEGGLVPFDADTRRAESFRKLFFAMGEDIRVVLIKLADRLHNMSTLGARSPEARRRVAQETMDIYAPLANRLGIWEFKWQLEDLAFRHLEPEAYKEIAQSLLAKRTERETYIATAISELKAELDKAGINAEITGRPKHIYSIYRKMQRRQANIDQIYDLLALRVLVSSVAECYAVLGMVHSIWRPLPSQFDDYIASPKDSGYQSLHTTVYGPDHQALEVQIKTHDMHKVAEMGVAAHWRYKEDKAQDADLDARVAWLRQIMDWQRDVAAGAQEFVESLKTDVFGDQVFAFTPRGEIKEMPRGSTPLDFAYRVHTEVGHRCHGAKVNGRMVPLDYTLKNGDMVEILTSRSSRGPSRDWLNPNLGYIHTTNAREKIRQWFRRQQRDEIIERGREALGQELRRMSIDNVKLDDLATLFKFDKLDDFLAAIGYGDIHPHHVTTRYHAAERQAAADELSVKRPSAPSSGGIRVLGVGDLLTRLGRCCSPVPGDSIVGFITRGKGVTVHRVDCHNVVNEDDRERLIPVDWGRTEQQLFPVTIRVDAWDRVGLARDIAALLADEGINITAHSSATNKDQTATVRATVEVSGMDKLSRVLSRLEGVRDVFSVVREAGATPVGDRR
jgi:GTP pyrophosphokinase